jgi:hypothetical protein
MLEVFESLSSLNKRQAIVKHSSSRSRRIVRLEASDEVCES